MIIEICYAQYLQEKPRRVGCSELDKNYVPFFPKHSAFNWKKDVR
jgi:hypothetical protein